MPTGRGTARSGTEERGRAGAATALRCLRRVVLTCSVADAGARTTAEFLEAQGISVVRVDTSAEDPFIDVTRLLPDIDMTDADAVITLGPPSTTALAIALLCDLPCTMAASIDGRRLAAIDAALQSGSAMHRSVLDVELDGVRRLSLTDLDITGSDAIISRAVDLADQRVVESDRLAIGPERPHSGRLCIDHVGGPVLSADAVEIASAPPSTRVAINGREQQFRRLTVRVHDKPLRELVLASHHRRRAVLDAARP